MSEPDIALHYHERGTTAVYSVLIELGQVPRPEHFGRLKKITWICGA